MQGLWDKTQRAVQKIESGNRERERAPEYRGRPGTEKYLPERLFSVRERVIAEKGDFRAAEGGVTAFG